MPSFPSLARHYCPFAACLSTGCPRTCKVVPAQSVYDITEASRYPAASRAPEVAFPGVPSELWGPRMCKVLPAWRVYDTPRQVVTLQRQLARRSYAEGGSWPLASLYYPRPSSFSSSFSSSRLRVGRGLPRAPEIPVLSSGARGCVRFCLLGESMTLQGKS